MDELDKAATQAVFEEGYAAGKLDAMEAHLADLRRLLNRSEIVQDRLMVPVLIPKDRRPPSDVEYEIL
jgi:hypothetical protein